MKVNLQKGQRVDLTKTNPGINNIMVGLGWHTNQYNNGADFDLDTAVFMLDKSGRATNEGDFIYYGNLKHSSGAVEHKGDNTVGSTSGDAETILINLQAVPSHIEKIDFTATIYEAAIRGQNFGQVNNAYIRIVDVSNNTEILRYDLGEDFSLETAVVVAQLYRHNGEWKFNAIGSGFDGGLAALCDKYGINATVNANRYGNRQTTVELKKGQKVSLVKTGNSLGEISINLNWAQPNSKGLAKLFSSGKIDLDLGCFFELMDGSKGVVQALGNAFGSMNQPPFVLLDGDDRSGSSKDGENIYVNGAMVSYIKRLHIFTFIYDGTPNWKNTQGVITVKCPGSPEIIVRMDDYGSAKRFCAIASLENVNNTLSIEKIVQFYDGHREVDAAFGWGLRWKEGRK